ncbi:MAG: T9SS type A sorting domain-containing protein [Bacteroidetes bacterium]|nr:T9SS type A sorting domain-containing protein [Bacteroidota bacterium]
MKTSLQYLFDRVVSFKSGAPLWTEKELRALVESSESPSPFPNKQSSMRWKIMIPGLFILAAGATYFYSTIDAPTTILSDKQQTAEIKQPAIIAETSENISQSTENDSQVKPKIHAPLHIEGIHVIDLTNEELTELGIHPTAGGGFTLTAKLGVEYKNPASLVAFMSNQPNRRTEVQFRADGVKSIVEKLGGQISTTFGVLKINVSIDTFGIHSKVVDSRNDTPKEVYPLVITHQSIDQSGEKKSQAQFFGNQADSFNVPEEYRNEIAGLFDLYSDSPAEKKDIQNFPLVGKLIPVRVSLGNEAKNSSSAEIIYWFYPSPTFIDKLPERYKNQLQAEVRAITKTEDSLKNKPTIPDKPLSPNETGEYKYTDVARSQSGAIAISAIGPNPAHDRTTIFYSLTAERTVSVALYDFSGRLVRTLATTDRVSAGEHHEITVNVGQLPTGAYLVTLLTDRGEQAIQRLIIQN